MNNLFKKNKYAAAGITAFLVIVASAFSVFVIFNFGIVLSGFKRLLRILTPIIDGFALALILTPLMNFVEQKWVGRLYKIKPGREMTPKRLRSRRTWSILVTFAIFFGLLFLFFRLVIPEVIASVNKIIPQFPKNIRKIEEFITKTFQDNPDLEETINSYITRYSIQLNNLLQQKLMPQAERLIKVFSLSVINVLKASLNMIIGIIVSIYLMSSKELFAGQIKKILYALYDTKEANRMISGIRYTHSVFIGFLGGKVIDSIIIGILTYIVTSIVHIPYAVLVSVIVGVTNIIPFFGPYIGAIPSILLVLMEDPMKALYLTIIIIIIQQVDGNIIGPKILGDSTGLSSFWVIFSITIFGGLFGLAGMLLGIPVFAVIYALVKYKINRRLRHKSLPEDTGLYISVGSIEEDGTFMEYVPVKGRSLLQILGVDKKKTPKPSIINEKDEEDKVDKEGEEDI